MAENRPRGRERNVTGSGKGVHRRRSGLGTGPVGAGGSGSGGGNRGSYGGGSSGGGLMRIILILLVLLGGGGGAVSTLLGGGDVSTDTGSSSYSGQSSSSGGSYSSGSGSSSGSFGSSSGSMSSLYSGLFGGSGAVSSGWSSASNSGGAVDTSVAEGSRAKYTNILGNNQDTVTLMVYMCGTDLESKSGMATSDLQEMANAKFGDNVNLLVYTGGCLSWRNSIVSSDVNQIYQVVDGGLKRLSSDQGSAAMTNPATLSSFIKWSAQNFPANRYELILWDHGGGSVSGYGYDEKNKRSGSMSLSGINQALQDGGVKFDFIGFDACLMATMENALMLSSHADYLVASEETEPGVGWYYTDWLTALGQNTSMPTVEIGKNIIDGFVETCNRKCPGQKTTLSIVDLAELSHTAPEVFTDFSKSIRTMISDKEYQTVATARNQTREFSRSSGIDQIDLAHFAGNLGNEEGEKLVDVVKSAVKYNRTSSDMTNSYGLSIYFPMQSSKYVDSMSQTYDAIDMDEEYTKCIREFASLQVSGQAASGGTGSPYGSLFGDYAGSFTGLSGNGSAELIGQLLGSFLGGDISSISGLSSGNASFLSDRALSDDAMTEYLTEHHFDATQLTWVTDGDTEKLALSEDQWGLVTGLDLNVFFDDGTGYVDLGLDNVYDFDEEGRLIADAGETWISIDGQPVAYYHLDTVDDGTDYTISGRVPCMLNGDRADLLLQFTDEDPTGSIVGAVYDYSKDEDIQVVAKNLTELSEGDQIDFLCDYYSYDGEYQDSYYLGEPLSYRADLPISDTYLDGPALVTYRFTDIYQTEYWTEAIRREA